MSKQSAGILLYKLEEGDLKVLLVHPGGPMHTKRDIGAWSVPKGEYSDDEDPQLAAKREFEEETGQSLTTEELLPLGTVKQKSGKVVIAWAVEGDLDADNIVSNTCMIQWPPKSKRMIEIPEVDRAAWFDIETAKEKINPAQAAFIDRLIEQVDV